MLEVYNFVDVLSTAVDIARIEGAWSSWSYRSPGLGLAEMEKIPVVTADRRLQSRLRDTSWQTAVRSL
jgi:hypothetical protein